MPLLRPFAADSAEICGVVRAPADFPLAPLRDSSRNDYLSGQMSRPIFWRANTDDRNRIFQKRVRIIRFSKAADFEEEEEKKKQRITYRVFRRGTAFLNVRSFRGDGPRALRND